MYPNQVKPRSHYSGLNCCIGSCATLSQEITDQSCGVRKRTTWSARNVALRVVRPSTNWILEVMLSNTIHYWIISRHVAAQIVLNLNARHWKWLDFFCECVLLIALIQGVWNVVPDAFIIQHSLPGLTHDYWQHVWMWQHKILRHFNLSILWMTYQMLWVILVLWYTVTREKNFYSYTRVDFYSTSDIPDGFFAKKIVCCTKESDNICSLRMDSCLFAL